MTKRISKHMDTGNGETAAVGAVALGGMISGAGGTTITTCKDGDDSFYCKFVKGFNIFKMILFIIAVLVIVYMLWKAFGSGKKRR